MPPPLSHQLRAGEGPIWDDRTQTLYFVDIPNGVIYGYSPADGSHTSLSVGQAVGSVAITSDPELLLAACERDILLVRVSGDERGVVRTLATSPEEHGTAGMRFNDGKVSPQGAFVVGRMHTAWRQGEKGRLYCLAPGEAELREIMDQKEVHLPNGGWSFFNFFFFFF